MKKYYILLNLLVLLFLSCFGNKESNTNIVQSKSEETKNNVNTLYTATLTDVVYIDPEFISYIDNINNIIYEDDEDIIDEMKKFIYENDRRNMRGRNEEITFIKKINFGIPDGDNWIVQINNDLIIVFAINNFKIIKRYSFINEKRNNVSNFNIMQNIPGIHIGDSISAIGDYNNDGICDIFQYVFGGMGTFLFIYSYNIEEDYFILQCEIPFSLLDYEHGPAPVEFINYKGINGFKVFYKILYSADGPGYNPEPNPKNNKWFFYTWDNDQGKYIELCEIKE